MKLEIAAFTILAAAAVYYMKQIERITLSTHDLFQASADIVTVHEKRLVRVEEAVQEVPALRKDIKEIKEILMARGIK